MVSHFISRLIHETECNFFFMHNLLPLLCNRHFKIRSTRKIICNCYFLCFNIFHKAFMFPFLCYNKHYLCNYFKLMQLLLLFACLTFEFLWCLMESCYFFKWKQKSRKYVEFSALCKNICWWIAGKMDLCVVNTCKTMDKSHLKIFRSTDTDSIDKSNHKPQRQLFQLIVPNGCDKNY